MSIIIDIIILGILALCIILGYHKGLTGSLLKIVSFVLALVIAFVLFKPISNLIIDKTTWDDSLEQGIRDTFLTNNETKQETENKEEQNMPNVMVDYINKAVEDAGNQAKETIVDMAARNVAVTIINAGVWIALFIIARIIHGMIEAVLIIYGILAVLSFISPVIDNVGIIAAIQKSYIGSMLYNNNLLLKLIF